MALTMRDSSELCFNLGPTARMSGIFHHPFSSSWGDIAGWGYFWGNHNNTIYISSIISRRANAMPPLAPSTLNVFEF
jgi:hypothetical protein